VPFVRLRHHFGLGGASRERENVLVVQHEGARAGLAVDELHGASQAVIKPLGGYFRDVPGIAGSSILGNGRVALILDTPAILRALATAS
jgi:two-component system chemotaxis sensor kinase CheA